MNTGLNEKTLNLIKSVFVNYDQIEKVYIFGSRAKGNYRPNSDIDLAISGEVDSFLAEKIALNLEELPLPYKFDVQSYEGIKKQELKEHINRVGVVIYSK